jgi:hypothetical protein
MAKGPDVTVEFESAGHTYQIQAEDVTFSPYYYVNQVKDSVGTYDDLISGKKILVNWSQVGVIRFL